MKSTSTILINLPPAEKTAAVAAARKRGETLTAWLRALIRNATEVRGQK